jgi:hypothetical protein
MSNRPTLAAVPSPILRRSSNLPGGHVGQKQHLFVLNLYTQYLAHLIVYYVNYCLVSCKKFVSGFAGSKVVVVGLTVIRLHLSGKN